IFLMLFRGKKYGMKSQIPFGPFLVAGSLLAFFVNINIMDWLYVL
ncbi:MAG: prepilin peptidase, partial [Candidatus Tagabacteria bacterium CG10_big_fil_rev_8_21_14_0_10_40_13]